MNILLAGANGLLGRSVKEYFFSKGVNVFILSRNESKKKDGDQEIIFPYDRINSNVPSINNKFDLLINCAFDYQARNSESKHSPNIIIIDNLIKLYKKNNIKKFINISSVNATESNESKYGQLKRKIERMVEKIDGSMSIRLGILEDSQPIGMIKTLRSVNKGLWPFSISIGSKEIPVYITKIDHVNKFLLSLMNVESFAKKITTLVNKVEDLNEIINEQKRSINISIPIILLRFALKSYECLLMPKMRFNQDSLTNLLSFDPKLLNPVNIDKQYNLSKKIDESIKKYKCEK